MTGSGSSCATCSLRGGGLGDPRDLEGLDATVDIELALQITSLEKEGKTVERRAKRTSLARPASTTYLTLGIVMEVSATLVAITTRRVLGGGSSKTFICFSVERSE